MDSIKRIPLEKYASMHKMSLYQVIQKVKREELQSEIEVHDGKKTTYIVVDVEASASASSNAEPEVPQETTDYKAAYEALKVEFEAYKRKCEGEQNA